jgi:hypothetical protein
MRAVRVAAVAFAAAVATVVATSCERDVPLGADFARVRDAGADSPRGSGGTAGAAGAASSDSGAGKCRVVLCTGHKYACGNCIDDDGDGLVDLEDPDCLGPCQNTEDSFYGGIPGQNHAGCLEDCYFDSDSGSGNDGCIWSHECDPLEVAPSYPPVGARCAYREDAQLARGLACATVRSQEPAQCLSVCLPLTPNGCDCFGCCKIPGAATPVWVGSVDDVGNPTCDLAHVGDPSRCEPCTQVEACLNPCDTCELCVGKRTLPPECSGTDCVAPTCPGGHQPCGLACLPECPSGQICITGCCAPPPG